MITGPESLDLFEWAKRQPPSAGNSSPRPLPMRLILESFEIDYTSRSYLRWRHRPQHHFKSVAGFVAFNNNWAGRHAGCSISSEYAGIFIGGKKYPLHRIVYAVANQRDPWPLFVDHKNGDSLDNRPENLREATSAQNNANRCKKRRYKGGLAGTTWVASMQKWRASITLNFHRRDIGLFDTAEEASAAYHAAARQIHGEFHWEGRQ